MLRREQFLECPRSSRTSGRRITRWITRLLLAGEQIGLLFGSKLRFGSELQDATRGYMFVLEGVGSRRCG